MVAQLKCGAWVAILAGAMALAGCGEPAGQDLSKVDSQPAADLQKGAQAQSIKDWAAANPNNGAMGSGEGGGK